MTLDYLSWLLRRWILSSLIQLGRGQRRRQSRIARGRLGRKCNPIRIHYWCQCHQQSNKCHRQYHLYKRFGYEARFERYGLIRMEPGEEGRDITPHCQWPTHDRTHTPATWTNILFRFSYWAGVILRNWVSWSKTAPVHFRYLSKASVAIRSKVVPTRCHCQSAQLFSIFIATYQCRRFLRCLIE